MKRILLLTVLTLSLFGYGQEINPYRFTSVVDLYEFPTVGATGNLDAQLPLYSINTRGFELPLSLGYDQMGNSNVFYIGNQFGDAWVLNAIGTISREIGDARTVSQGSVTGAVMCGDMHHTPFTAKKFMIGPYVPDELYYQNNSSTKYRFSPDHYTFSFMGLSGKFTIYNDNGVLKPQLLESSDFAKIEVVQPASYELISTIYIYDKNGYKYKFSSPSNINQNNYFETVSLTSPLSVPMGCHFTIEVNHTPALVPNDELLLKDFVISRQIFTDGKPFWRNLELTEIYDKDNVLLVSYEYDTVGMSNADSGNRWVNGLGLNQTSQKLFLKKINIINQGNIIFNNVLGTNQSNVVNSYTSSIEIKDLKDNLIKKFTLDFVKHKVDNLTYIKDNQDGSSGLVFEKRLLTGIKEYNNNTPQNFLHTTVDYKDASSINNTTAVIDRYGFLTRIGYCPLHISLNDYRANAFMLQKIKYPTGGSVVYEFEPNTFSHSMGILDFKDHNYDNHVYQSLPLTQLTDGVTFNANEGDKIFVLNKSNSTSLLLYKTIGTNQLIKSGFVNKDGPRFLTNASCKHLLSNVVLPASDNGKYTFKYSSGYTSASNIEVYRLNYNSTYYNFRYAEGNRIAKTAYFKDNVLKTILNTPTGEASAEKVITFDYSDLIEANTSSGRVRLTHVNDLQLRPFNVIYNEVTTNLRGIGKQYTKYDFAYNATWDESIRTDIKESKLYGLSDQLFLENNYSYTYGIEPYHFTAGTDFAKPFILSSSVNTKNYEGASFTASVNSTVFDSTKRQIVSQTTEDNLGKVIKSEFDYDVKNNKIVNTQQRNYIDNNLTEQLLNTYGTTGDFIKTEFKTPEMSAYEKVGNENNKYIGGLLRGYIQPDGTPVTLVYGYLDTQVIAKMVNVDANVYYDSPSYQTIRSNLDMYSTQWHSNYSEANLKAVLNTLRTTFPNALVTTYTYKPMVGVSSVTDENGKTTTYEYDTFNRLATVKDYLGNILKEYHYNFTN